MTGGRHRPPEPVQAPKPVKSPKPRAEKPPRRLVPEPGPLQELGAATVVAVLVVAVAGLVYLVMDDRRDERVTSAPVSSTTAAPTLLPEEQEAAVRDAYFEQATDRRGFTSYYTETGNAPGLGIAVCSQLNADATATGVWNAAAELEDGPYALPDEVAWAFVDLAVTVYCPEHEVLVTDTIRETT